MAVEVRRVETRRELKRFVHFPESLFRDDPNWVPPLYSDDLHNLRRDRNPAFEFCDAAYWLAYKDGKPVGRIAGILNRRAIEIWGERLARFGWVDFIDDAEVSAALFGAFEAWCREQGLEGAHGPLGFTDLDPEGMLVEGFDELGTLATIQNPPYYPEHLERLGYAKEIDWIEFRVEVPKEHIKRLSRLRERVERSIELEVVRFKKLKEFRPYARPVLELLNEAYADLHGFVPLTDAQLDDVIKRYFGFLRPEFLYVLLDDAKRLAGFGLTMPSLARAMQKSRGRLFPFGWFHLLKAMKSEETLDLLLVAVRKDLQGKGVNVFLIDECLKVSLEQGIKWAETNPELETNSMVHGQWKFFGNRQHKRRRCFIKSLKTG